MRFGERVKELRLQRKLTQQKVAEKIGVTVGYISKVEKERRFFPPPFVASAFAEVEVL